MSTLDSTSTDAEIVAAVKDNASYHEDGSVAKCRAFITAVEMYLFDAPRRFTHGGRSGLELELDTEMLERRLTGAKRWLDANAGVTAGGAGVSYADFRSFRS